MVWLLSSESVECFGIPSAKGGAFVVMSKSLIGNY